MQNFSTLASAFAMVAAFLLVAGGARLSMKRQTRARGILMIVAALVIITNVMIWTM